MADDHKKWINYYFSTIQSLESQKTKLSNEIQRNQALLGEEVFGTCVQHAKRAFAASSSSSALSSKQDILNKRLAEVCAASNSACATLLRAGDFDTKKFTKYLANILSHETENKWLPIRYLLKPATRYTRQVEGYAVLQADALYSLPGLPDTLTLLDHKYHNPLSRSLIKYRESVNPHAVYQNVENFDNIWMFTSQNFISIGTEETFNAFVNKNQITNKPFLHVCLDEQNVEVLHNIEKVQNVCYNNYSEPQLPEAHPRMIAINALTDLINTRLYKREVMSQKGDLTTNNMELCAARSYGE